MVAAWSSHLDLAESPSLPNMVKPKIAEACTCSSELQPKLYMCSKSDRAASVHELEHCIASGIEWKIQPLSFLYVQPFDVVANRPRSRATCPCSHGCPSIVHSVVYLIQYDEDSRHVDYIVHVACKSSVVT